MSEIVLLENAPTGPDHRQLAHLWFADNRLRTMRGCPRGLRRKRWRSC